MVERLKCENYPSLLFYLDSEDISESQPDDEESNPSGKKAEKDKKTSFCGRIKQIWPQIEGQHQNSFGPICKKHYPYLLSGKMILTKVVCFVV